MMPLFENEEAVMLRAELAATKGREERLRALLVEIRAESACRCDEPWTSRGLHQPNECRAYLIEDIDAVLGPPRGEATKGREERLLAALVGLVDYERRRYPPKMGGDEYPPSLRKVMAVADAALAEKPEGGGR